LKKPVKMIAHKRDDGTIQTVAEHLKGTAKLAEKFGAPPLKNVLKNSGLLHDIGKYQNSFQERIKGKNIRVDHSTCGAISASQTFNAFEALVLEYIIAGHHAGIPDGGDLADQPSETSTLSARLKKKDLEDWSQYKQEVSFSLSDNEKLIHYFGFLEDTRETAIDKFAFLVRYCYSCLVDADSLDTEHFCQQIERTPLKSNFQICINRLNHHISQFICTTELQKARSRIQAQAYENIKKDAEVYLMNMPTGSGKTLCSAKCALMKAIATKKKRIIYVIPFNSIIDQTAREFEDIFGEEAEILRHQSTYDIEDKEDASDAYKVRFSQATENWDADFIITTAVQFFETTFSNKRSRLRKMHNMADSVIIFDEAHLMPLNFLQPCLESVAYLTRYFGSRAIFLTATMPNYKDLLHQYGLKDLVIQDLIPDQSEFHFFKKCDYHDLGIVSFEGLYEKAEEAPSSLIVVNSRKTAKAMYEDFGGKNRGNLYHLSTHMTKIDIEDTIQTIKSRLQDIRNYPEREQIPLIVISTSLIEAGVDLDFHRAFREYTGLDSLLQTGGRCNREGRDPNRGQVYIFGIEGNTKADDIRSGTTKNLLHQYADVSDLECIATYYNTVYFFNQDNMTKNAIHNHPKCGNDLTGIPFASYNGEMINNLDESIIIPDTEEIQKILERSRYTALTRKDYRRLQRTACSVTHDEFEELKQQGVIETNQFGVTVLTNLSYYHKEVGIVTEGEDIFI
jgi:CRISPR-associated endonuclease/helicase Cas3